MVRKSFSFDRSSRLRIRRVFRRRQRQVESATSAAGIQVENNFIARLDRLFVVKRFVVGWLLLSILIVFCTILQTLALSGYYQTLRPVAGGTYSEGIVGTYSNASPLYASGAVDTTLSHLLFSGLFKYDMHNALIGDLANSYNIDSTGKHYTVGLRKGLTWQDGKPLTAADVVFTYKTIQDPDANSPLLPSWQGITVSAIDASTVKFDLPNPLSSFAYSLTNGIVPQHLLASISPSQLRSNDFNTTHPVGSGPFSWQAIEVGNTTDPARATTYIALKPFKHYAGGVPKLDGYVVRAYASDDNMVAAYASRDINAMAGLQAVPASLKGKSNMTVYNFASTAAQLAFFKTSSQVLSDVQVRQALVKGADTAAIIKGLPYQTRAVREPLLQGQLAYDAKYAQFSFNPSAAQTQLDAAGWQKNADGTRSKDGQQLTFRLVGEDTPENTYVMNHLVADWKKIGVNAVAVPEQPADLQTTLELHNYDALLHGISIGVDPDVFAYWDSSQTDIRSPNRLNFSEYKSNTADAALEAGRTRADQSLRVIKYRAFLLAWQTDAPALGLYQPRFLYISRSPVYNLNEHTLNADSDRYYSVANWEIHTARISN